MRIFRLIQISAVLLVISIFYYFIEPKLPYSMLFKVFIFTLILLTLSFLTDRLDGRIQILEKRIDKQLSVWIVVGLLILPLLIPLFT